MQSTICCEIFPFTYEDNSATFLYISEAAIDEDADLRNIIPPSVVYSSSNNCGDGKSQRRCTNAIG